MGLTLTGFSHLKEIDPPNMELGLWDNTKDADTDVMMISNGCLQPTTMTVVIADGGVYPAKGTVTTNAHGTFLVKEIQPSDVTGNQSDEPTLTFTLELTEE